MTSGEWLLDVTRGRVTSVYGVAGSGKSNLCLWILSSTASPSLYISTEGSIPVELLDRYSLTMKGLYFREALSLEDLAIQLVEVLLRFQLFRYESICVDSINAHYRYEVWERQDANRLLNAALAALSYLASRFGVRVLLTAQVREEEGEVVPSGYDLIEFWSDVIAEVRKLDDTRVLRIVKPEELKDRKVGFRISSRGLFFVRG